MTLFHTVHNAQWRRVKADGFLLLDITVKTGEKVFAPTWDNLMAYKRSELSEGEYTERYVQKMRASLTTHPALWRGLFDGTPRAVGCFCAKGTFCHRYIFVGLLESYAKHHHLPMHYAGELYAAA